MSNRESHTTKQEAKLYKALQTLLHNSVDNFGTPKLASVKQLKKAYKALTDYDNFVKRYSVIVRKGD